jgi:hypothetical protein
MSSWEGVTEITRRFHHLTGPPPPPSSEHFVGKVRKDPSGRKAHVWDAGNNPDTPSKALDG